MSDSEEFSPPITQRQYQELVGVYNEVLLSVESLARLLIEKKIITDEELEVTRETVHQEALRNTQAELNRRLLEKRSSKLPKQ